MAIVKVKVDGFAERDGELVNYAFERTTDAKGQITGTPQGGKVTIRVKALAAGFKPELLSWMTQGLEKKGSVEFEENGTFIKALEFEKAFCVKFREEWAENQGWWEEVELTCKTLKLKPIEYEAQWKNF